MSETMVLMVDGRLVALDGVITARWSTSGRQVVPGLARTAARAVRAVVAGDSEAPVRLPKGASILGRRRASAGQIVEALDLAGLVAEIMVARAGIAQKAD